MLPCPVVDHDVFNYTGSQSETSMGRTRTEVVREQKPSKLSGTQKYEIGLIR
jgi:hypothetical protein